MLCPRPAPDSDNAQCSRNERKRDRQQRNEFDHGINLIGLALAVKLAVKDAAENDHLHRPAPRR